MTAAPGIPAPGTHLCTLADLRVTGARGVDFEQDGKRFSLFLVMTDQHPTPRAYVNRCPHAGTPLELAPHGFLTRDRSMILCRTHGARFRINDGLCVAGPCRGQSLEPIPVIMQHAAVCIPPLPLTTSDPKEE